MRGFALFRDTHEQRFQSCVTASPPFNMKKCYLDKIEIHPSRWFGNSPFTSHSLYWRGGNVLLAANEKDLKTKTYR